MKRLQPQFKIALRDELACASTASTEARFIHRLHAVLLVSMGCSCYEVAHWFDDDPRSIERWVHAYEHDGTAGLRDHRYGGRSSPLTTHMRTQISKAVLSPPAQCGYAHAQWTGKLLARFVLDHFGLQASERQCQRWIKDLHREHLH